VPHRSARPILPTRFLEQAETDYGLPVSERWLLVKRPFPDESLASWFARQAEMMGSDTRQLAHVLSRELGKSPEALLRDVDVAIADAAALRRLAARAAVPATMLFRMATPRLFGDGRLGCSLIKDWLVRRTHAGKLAPATHLCPACLASDRLPYLRRDWRLGWFTTCEVHRLSLIDACPQCGYSLVSDPISIHRLLHNSCPACGSRLDSMFGDAPFPEVLALEDKLRKALRAGEWEPAPGYRSTSLALATIVDRLFRYLLAKSIGRADTFFVIRHRHLLTVSDRYGRSPAGTPLLLREDMLRMIGKLLAQWPVQMMRIVDNEHFGRPWRPPDGSRLHRLVYHERDCHNYAVTLFEQLSLPLEVAPLQSSVTHTVSRRRRSSLDYDALLKMLRYL
jgi:hypothetical protein